MTGDEGDIHANLIGPESPRRSDGCIFDDFCSHHKFCFLSLFEKSLTARLGWLQTGFLMMIP